MNEKIYDIDFRKWATWQVPVLLRRERMLALVMSLITPVVTLYNSFILFRKASLYKLLITPQVCYLEKLLNDRYDTVLRRIYIGKPQRFDELYLYQEAEEKPVAFYQDSEGLPVILYADAETGATTADFIVNVPISLTFNEIEFNALLELYKLPDKVHAINRI